MPPITTTQIRREAGLGAIATLAMGLASGGLTWLAMPPRSWWSLTFAVPLPLVIAALRTRMTPLWAGVWSALGMLPFWCVTLRWMYAVTDLGYLPACLLQSFWTFVFVWVLARVQRARQGRRSAAFVGLALLVPLLWCGVEFVRGDLAFGGFSSALLATPLIDAPGLAAPAAFLGVYFVSLLACVPAGALAEAIVPRPGSRRRAMATIALAAACWAWCAWTIPSTRATSHILLGLVQTNIPQNNKSGWTLERELEDFERFAALTREAAEGRPDLIVWPETMVPGATIDPDAVATLKREQIVLDATIDGQPRRISAAHFADALVDLQRALNIPMLVGEEGVENFSIKVEEDGGIRFLHDARFNSVYFVSGGAVQTPRYDKMALTPFGEYMPGIRLWPWLERQFMRVGARGMSFNLDVGRTPTVFQVPVDHGAAVARVVTPICFESTYSGQCRRLVFGEVGRRADVMINMSNDGWFASSDDAREEHVQIARWRCVELATPMALASNTGISVLVDASGRVALRGVEGSDRACRVDGVLVGALGFDRAAPATLYSRVGNLFGWACFASLGLAAIASIWRGGPKRADREPAVASTRRSKA